MKIDIFISAGTVVLPAVDPTTMMPHPTAIAFGDGRGFGQAGTSRVTQVVLFDKTTLVAAKQAPVASPSTTIFAAFSSPAYSVAANTVTATASTSSVDANWTYPSASKIAITFSGNPSNPTVAGSPGITYSITVTYDKSTASYQVTYNTDKYPSYEVTANGVSLLRLSEVSVWKLIPMWPNGNQTGRVGAGYFPLLSGAMNFNDIPTFNARAGGSIGWYDPSQLRLVPNVQLGEMKILDYRDSAGRTWEY